MKVVCIKEIHSRFNAYGQRMPLGWIPKMNCIYTVVGIEKYWGVEFYQLGECPDMFERFEASGFRPMDFGEIVCEEIESQFVKEMEEELV